MLLVILFSSQFCPNVVINSWFAPVRCFSLFICKYMGTYPCPGPQLVIMSAALVFLCGVPDFLIFSVYLFLFALPRPVFRLALLHRVSQAYLPLF